MTNTKTDSRTLFAFSFLIFLSWLGMMLHNAQELPQLTLLSPEELYPTLIYVALMLAYIRLPRKRVTLQLILGWALLHLFVGGILTVIPFPFLPFYPEQTPQHYLAHVVYSVAQLPLIAFIWGELRVARAPS